MDFPSTIQQALSGDQDAYTHLYKAILPLAKSRLYHRFYDLWKDSPELAYEAMHHLLINLHKCPQTEYFLPWARKVFINFYMQELRDRSTIKHRLLSDAKSLDDHATDQDGDEYETHIEHPKDYVKQLEANIDATFILSRVRGRFRKAAIQREMYGYDELDRRNGADVGTWSDLYELRRSVAQGGYLDAAPDEGFTLPAIVI